MDRALVIVDLQNDFCPGGALAVPEGDTIVPIINKLIPKFKWIVETKDWHPKDHCSFVENGGIWPPHCIRGTVGAKLHKDLSDVPEDKLIVIYKGINQPVDSYSAFFDNDKTSNTELNEILREVDEENEKTEIDTLYVTGLATDYCVKFTVLDGLSLGYKVYVITDAVKGVNVNEGDVENALKEMEEAGAILIISDKIDDGKKKFIDTYAV